MWTCFNGLYFFDKKKLQMVLLTKIMKNKELAKELQKPIIRKFEKGKVHSTFIDNIWGVDVANMQLVSKFNKGFIFLLYAIDIYSKYAWVISLKGKKCTTITDFFQNVLNDLIANQIKYR